MATFSVPRRAGSKRQRRTASAAAWSRSGWPADCVDDHVGDAAVVGDVHAQQRGALNAEPASARGIRGAVLIAALRNGALGDAVRRQRGHGRSSGLRGGGRCGRRARGGRVRGRCDRERAGACVDHTRCGRTTHYGRTTRRRATRRGLHGRCERCGGDGCGLRRGERHRLRRRDFRFSRARWCRRRRHRGLDGLGQSQRTSIDDGRGGRERRVGLDQLGEQDRRAGRCPRRQHDHAGDADVDQYGCRDRSESRETNAHHRSSA